MMGEEAPPARVDVICPAYNRSGAIRETVDSVLAQTVGDWRLIVVSDGSTDDTDEVVRSYSDPRVRLVRTEHHGAPGGPRNIGLAVSDAPYVAYLDSDDRWLPGHLEGLLRHLEAGARLVVMGSVAVDGDGAEVARSDLLNRVWHPDLQLVWPLYEPSRVGHARGLVEAAGGWSTGVRGMEDWDLWLRLADRGEDFTVASEHTAVMRLNPGSRRHTTAIADYLPLGAVATEDDAKAVLEAVFSGENQDRLRRSWAEMTVGWYRSMAASDRLSKAEDVDMEKVYEQLRWYALKGHDRLMLGDLTYVEDGGEFVLVRPLRCVDDAHAERLRAFLWTGDHARNSVVHEAVRRRGGRPIAAAGERTR
ncbi:glycosyltransferase family 2 protein [Actinomadura litoris]|uniref:glycosyltransferase family 2 protein n=1 Tax=Actinomadura litoris TaxID=2678616 RepID=UPI001FA79C6E|nr:glycosyltransferase family 2 protein [Actinomadura litoris]